MRYAKFDSRLTRDSTSCSIGFSSHVMWCKFKYYSYCTQLYIFTAITNYHIYIYIYIYAITHDQQRPEPRDSREVGAVGSIGFNWQTDALESRSFERDWLNLQCAALESKLYIYHIIYMLYLMIPSAATGTVTSFGAGLCARVILTWLLWHGHLRSGVRGQRRDFFFGARFLLEWKIFF